MKLGYLGPAGTFTEQAALIVRGNSEIIAYHTIKEVVDAVNSGEIIEGIVPIENSTEGTVNITVDSLVFDSELFIKKQLELSIQQNFLIKKDTDVSKITKILSHPQGLAQCRKFITENFPNADTIETSSTSEAARLVSESDEAIAAIGLKNSADIYNLRLYKENIQDRNDNFTTFVLISKKEMTPSVQNKKTSVAFSTVNEPGQLYKILDIFSIWDLNLTKIVSRPMRNKPKEYVFYVDLEGNNDDKDLADSLNMINRKTSFFKFLGSYPVDDMRKKQQ